MKAFGPDVVISGQLVHWEYWYDYLLLRAQQHEAENWQHWALLNTGAVELGSDFGEPINPALTEAISQLKAKMVKDPVLGEVSVYDLIFYRLKQFQDVRTVYEPFTGPLRDVKGNVLLRPGEAIDGYKLWWGLEKTYVEGIIPP
jgi:simple sugar transport system substrate-binding protein